MGVRRVMGGEHSRCLDGRRAGGFRPFDGKTGCLLDRLSGDPARPQQSYAAVLYLDDGGFHADRAGAAIHDEFDPAAEIGLHMLRRGRADLAGGIGAGGGERLAEGADQVAGKALRHSYADGVEPGGCQRMDRASGFQRNDQRQRPRPEAVRQRARDRIERRITFRHRQIRHVADQRVEARPPFRFVNAGDRRRIGGVGRKPVDGLGRQRHGLRLRKNIDRRADCVLPVAVDRDQPSHFSTPSCHMSRRP